MKVALIIAATILLIMLIEGSAPVLLIAGGLAVAILLFRRVIKADPAEGWRRVAIWTFLIALPAGAYTITGEFTKLRPAGWLIPVAFLAAGALFILALVKRARASRPGLALVVAAPSRSREPSIDEEVRRFQTEIRAEELAHENDMLRRRLAAQEFQASMPEDPAADEPQPRARA